MKLPRIFSDNMVLQQGAAAAVWGRSAPGGRVTVAFAGQKKSAAAGADGKWIVRLDPMRASAEGRDLVIDGPRRVVFGNVLVGDVWLCSGQSNMVFHLKDAEGGERAAAEAAVSDIRLYTANAGFADQPRDDLPIDDRWQVCAPQTAKFFSAVAFFFARRLRQAVNVPIGLIVAAMGGSRIEAWMSREALQAVPPGRRFLEIAAGERTDEMRAFFGILAERHEPAMLYNAMIHPIKGFGLRGVLWYQGETNAVAPATHPALGRRYGSFEYREFLAAMIASWRRDFGDRDLPFVIVQLPNYDAGGDDSWAVLRESQRECLKLPNTALAVAIDVGDPHDAHPKAKRQVGERLALAALATVYERDAVGSGPLYKALRVEGSRGVVSFLHVGGGLATGGGEPAGFALAGEDRRFVPAQARIRGREVVVWSDEVAHPAAVRYAWANDPACNLYNAEGLPAVPFRTDDWPAG